MNSNDMNFSLCWDYSKGAWMFGNSEAYFHTIDLSVENDTQLEDANSDGSLNCLAASEDKKYLALGTNNEVLLRRFPNIADSVKTIHRTILPVRDIKFSHSSRFLVFGGQDPNVLVYSVDDSDLVETIETNSTGVRAISLSRNDKHLAVMDMDGNLSMIDMSPISFKKDRVCSFHKSLISKDVSRAVDTSIYEMAWCQQKGDKNILFVPGRSGAINVLTRDVTGIWRESMLMGDPTSKLSHHSNDVNYVAISPNNAFLCSADVSGSVLIWKIDHSDITKSIPINVFQQPSPVLSLKWGFQDGDNYLVALLSSTFKKIENAVPLEYGSPVKQVADLVATQEDNISDDALLEGVTDEMLMNVDVDQVATEAVPSNKPILDDLEDAEFTETVTKDKRKRLQKNADTNDEDDEDKLLLEAPALPATNNTSSFKRTPLFTSEEAPKSVKDLFDDEAVKVSDKQLLKEALKEEEEDDFDDDLDDDSMIVDKVAAPKKFSGDIMDIAKALEQSGALAAVVATKLQPAFQPSCTRSDEKNRRYLVWNSVGNITLREEAHENRVEIRFTDASRGNRNEAFPDRYGFVMGALGYAGAAFATPADELPANDGYNRDLLDAENPNPLKDCKGSTILYHAFPGSHHLDGVNENFLIMLSEGEEVKSIAVGAGFVAVATSRKLLRIFSSTGLEIAVISLRGPVVTLVALNDTLAVIYHAGIPFDETFDMALDMFRINWRQGYAMQSVVSNIAVPLSRKATLEWVGFDVDSVSVLALDSQGVMSTLMHTAGFQWTPVFNIMQVRKTIDHRYWPIMVKNGKLVYVLLNGESKPAIYPQPVVSTKALRVAIATHRDGKDMNDAAKEKMHSLLFEKMKVDNLQYEASQLVGKPELMEELQSVEAALEAQQLASDKVVLVAFQEACASQQIPLALSLGIRLKSIKSLMAGIKIANHFGRVVVAEALDGMMQHRQALEMYQQQLQYAAAASSMVTSDYEQQQQEYHVDPANMDDQYYQSTEENDVNAGGMLSRKASLKQQSRQVVNLEPAKKIVSPDANHHTANENKKADTASKPLNPFAVNKTGQTPQKRPASVLENLESPSPKKPVLNRQTTFSQNARKQHLTNKHIL